MIRARTDPSLKLEIDQILGKLGLTTTEAINLFFHQIKLRRGIPFDLTIPNTTTLKTFKNTDNKKNVVKCRDAKDMFNKLGL